jgi:cytochrome P450
MPFLDNLFLKNPIRLLLSKYGLLNANTYMVDFARTRLNARIDPKIDRTVKQDLNYVRNDFLSRFLAAHAKDPDFITNDRVLALTVANIFAGSDTTAISLRAVFYFLLKNPDTMITLMNELLEQKRLGNFAREDGLVDWAEVRELPYLSAVIKEALRCHPAVGLTLERVTPAQGATVCGQYIPGGTIIGCNAWVVHRDTGVFGHSPEAFRPSRWIEASEGQRKLMDSSIFTFGAGSRTCIGKNISLLEMYKFVPVVLMAFEVSQIQAADISSSVSGKMMRS